VKKRKKERKEEKKKKEEEKGKGRERKGKKRMNEMMVKSTFFDFVLNFPMKDQSLSVII